MRKYIFLVLLTSFVLSSCGKKEAALKPTPSPVPREYILADTDKPQISLTPRADGHELTLNISQIKPVFSTVEYELVYTAKDQGLEIEKGVSGTFENKDIVNGSVQRKILLGTESCTNGCKYKYDAGVDGGTLSVILETTDNQVASLEIPFSLENIKGKGFTITWK